MTPPQLAGLIVVSVMSVLLFWKLLERKYVADAFVTLISMFGFFAGFAWNAPLLIFMKVKSEDGCVSWSEWLPTICVLGAITIFGLVVASPFIPAVFVNEFWCGVAVTYLIGYVIGGLSCLFMSADASNNYWKK